MIAKPRGFLAKSGNSRPTVTVENRTKTGVLIPESLRKWACESVRIRYQPKDFGDDILCRAMTCPSLSRNIQRRRCHLGQEGLKLISPEVSQKNCFGDIHGCTILSRFFERLKCCCFWRRNASETNGKPPAVLLCVGSGKGMPSLFVK